MRCSAQQLRWLLYLLAIVELIPLQGGSAWDLLLSLCAEALILPGLLFLQTGKPRPGALLVWATGLSLCLLYQGMASFAPGWRGDLAIAKSLLILSLIAGVSRLKSEPASSARLG